MIFDSILQWFLPTRLSFGSSGGQTSNEFKPPSYTQPGWQNYLSGAQNLAAQGLPQYQGEVVAPLNPMTTAGLQQLSDFTQQGTPERIAGGQAIVNAAQGQMNPYAAAQNPFIGQNPYLSSMIDQSNSKIADRYQSGTAAQNDASFARSGAYGGSAWQDQTSRNQQDLASALASNTNTLLKGNYDQSASLAESGLNRGASGWQSGVGNSLQAAQVGIGQQGADQSAIQAMISGGQIPQQQLQQLLTAGQQYYQQGQQAPFTLSDFLGSALSRASGGQGTQTYTTPGVSPITAGLGGLGLGYAAWPGG